MSKFKKVLSVLLAAVLGTVVFSSFAGCGKKGIVIEIDGGGANGNFNTTVSMDKTPENPYPYNTLEKLAKEYTKLHPDVKIRINKTSIGNDRESVVAKLSQKQAPHLLFQVSPSWEEDAKKGWVVDLTDELEKPNPYVEAGQPGSEKWKDLYVEKELLATQAGDGKHYFVCLEKIPIGIIYNKAIFEQAGITKVPETFGELLDAQAKIATLGTNPYFPIYDWYDIFLEVSIFSRLFETYDIDNNQFISTEEIARAYYKGDWGISSTPTTEAEKMYRAYFRLMKAKCQYYPAAHQSYDALEEFLRGKVGMIEATGGYMAQIAADQKKGFDVGVFGFPTLTAEDYQNYGKDDLHTGASVYRGTAGLCTGYCVTNRAVKDGQATVDACIDFLKFITAPQNNDRMINDLGLGLPISAESENINPLFQPLVDMYNEDLKDPNRYDWNTFCSWNKFGKEYYDKFLNTVWAYQVKGGTDLDIALDEMAAATKTAIGNYMKLNGWTADRWD